MFKMGTASFVLEQARAAPMIQQCRLAAGNFPNLSDRISKSLDYSPPTMFLNWQLGEELFWETEDGKRAGQGTRGAHHMCSHAPHHSCEQRQPRMRTWVAVGSGGSGNNSTKQLLSHLSPSNTRLIFPSPSQPVTHYFTAGCHKPT